MTETLRLLAVFPHPDDETLGMGGTLAHYSAEGVETYLICATKGERGWNGPEQDDPGLAEMARIREPELRCAASHLGLHEINFLDIIDGDVDQADPQQATAKITAHIRRIRPQVVVTFSLDGHYGHPDHIALAQLTAAALVCAADASYHDPQGQAPFRVSKYYHMVDSKRQVATILEALGPISMEVDGVERSNVGWEEWAVTTRIDTRAYFDTVWQAVLCHQSQLPGYGPLLEQPRETLQQFFREGTFLRVFSLVNHGRAVEHDLFEGLR